MKEIRTIKMVERVEVKFVAEDGKEFTGVNAEKDCTTYELEQNKKAIAVAFAQLDAVKLDLPIVEFCSCEGEIWKVRLNSKKDYFTMVAYFENQHKFFDDYTDTPAKFPYTMLVHHGCEHISEYKNDLTAELKRALEQLEG